MFLIHETHERHEIKLYFWAGEVPPEPQTRGLRKASGVAWAHRETPRHPSRCHPPRYSTHPRWGQLVAKLM